MAITVFKNAVKSIFFMMLLLIAPACSESYFYESEVSIPEGVWNSQKAAIFEPVLKDTAQIYNVILSITNTDDYRHSNIWFFVKTTSPDGFSHKDTLEYFLAEETGKWLGKKDRDTWTRKLYFKNQIRFPNSGKYTFEVLQGMRDIELKGITKVGILLEKINQN